MTDHPALFVYLKSLLARSLKLCLNLPSYLSFKFRTDRFVQLIHCLVPNPPLIKRYAFEYIDRIKILVERKKKNEVKREPGMNQQ